MSIIYIAIVRDFKKILCEYAQYNGNFQQICFNILKRHKDCGQNELLIEYENYCFFLLNFNRLTIITLSDDNTSPNEVLYIMTNIKEKLLKKYTLDELLAAPAYSLADFITVIKIQITLLNRKASKICKIGKVIFK
jgi:endonuclease III